MSKIIEINQISGFLKDGMSIAIGGFMGCGNTHKIIDEILKTNVKDLTLVATDTARDDFGIGKLIASKKVKKLYASHIGTNKETQKQVIDGVLELEFVPQGTLAERLRAASAGLGGVLIKTGFGTEVAEQKEIIRVDGEDYLLEKPLHVDIAFINAYKADKAGNLLYKGSARNFNTAMAGAAKIAIAEVEEIVEVGQLDPNFIHTPFVFINHIIKA